MRMAALIAAATHCLNTAAVAQLLDTADARALPPHEQGLLLDCLMRRAFPNVEWLAVWSNEVPRDELVACAVTLAARGADATPALVRLCGSLMHTPAQDADAPPSRLRRQEVVMNALLAAGASATGIVQMTHLMGDLADHNPYVVRRLAEHCDNPQAAADALLAYAECGWYNRVARKRCVRVIQSLVAILRVGATVSPYSVLRIRMAGYWTPRRVRASHSLVGEAAWARRGHLLRLRAALRRQRDREHAGAQAAALGISETEVAVFEWCVTA
jgi:hypothetical protein